MARRISNAVLACVLASTVLAACADNTPGDESAGPSEVVRTAEPGESISDENIPQLDVGILGQVPQLDPAKNPESGFYLLMLGMESLLRIDAKGDLQPWLATGFEQVSDTVYEYTLRDDVTFWDGTEFTSADVKYSWDYLRAPESRRAQYFASVDTIETPDDRTVRVTLKQPDATWQYTPASWYGVVFQKAFAEEQGDKFGQPGTLVEGTGPWKFDSLNPTSGLELSAYDGYWGGKPPVEKISVKTFADDNSMGLALRAGEIDITPTVNGPKGFDAAAGGGTVFTTPTCATALLSMPTQEEPWNDIHVRRAVAHVINRDDIVAATQDRAGGPLDYLISPVLLESLGTEEQVDAALETVTTYPHDLEKAKEEMAQSSVPDGFSYEFKTPSSYASIVEVIAAQLGEIGIDIEIEAMGDTAWYSEIAKDDRPLTFTETGACTPDPSWDAIYLETDDSGQPTGLNLAQYDSPEVEGLLEDGITTQDPQDRLEIYTSVLQQLGEDVPYVPIYAEGNTYASTEYDIVEFDSYWFSEPWVLNVVPR